MKIGHPPSDDLALRRRLGSPRSKARTRCCAMPAGPLHFFPSVLVRRLITESAAERVHAARERHGCAHACSARHAVRGMADRVHARKNCATHELNTRMRYAHPTPKAALGADSCISRPSTRTLCGLGMAGGTGKTGVWAGRSARYLQLNNDYTTTRRRPIESGNRIERSPATRLRLGLTS